MALTVLSFTVSQSPANKAAITFTDTSTGSDPTLTARRIFLKKTDGTYLVESGVLTTYNSWILTNTSQTFILADRDYSLEATVQWMNGAVVVYSKVVVILLKAYAESFRYSLTQFQSSNPLLLTNKNYYANKMKLAVLIDDAFQAVDQYSDQTTSQYCLDAAKRLTDNPSNFF